ncbi:class I tRNA ligase family protein, partial [Patescibacteria group bacterium]|nr:class I tRNA ligase family protein [Patescibacteria group bacterium]
GGKDVIKEVYTGNGISVNSEFLDGLETKEAIKKIIEWLEKKGLGKKEINYKLRDWCISRQRYWGPPIPMVFCENCKKIIENSKFQITNHKSQINSKFKIQNYEFTSSEILNPGWVPVPEKDLPVLLPEMDDFLPDGSGKGPLNKVKDFVNTTCPKCGGQAKRETDVSDPFVDSSWYFMRYPCTEFKDRALDKKRLKKWMSVDMYIGGKEHSVLHLLYSRFVTMVMHELGYVPEEEPYKRFRAHGLLIAGGAKISKSKGNIVNPDEYIKKYGADAVRMYLMFLGDMRQGGDWRDSGMAGMHRFVNRIYKLINKIISKTEKIIPEPSNTAGRQMQNAKCKMQNLPTSKLLHKTIKGVGEDLEKLKFNTAISKLMILVNMIQEQGCKKETFKKFVIMLSPFAPHLAEELWEKFGHKESVLKEKWPAYNSKLVKDEIIELVIQVNGKVRDRLEVSADISEEEAKELAIASEKIKKWIEGKNIIKIIYIKSRLVNIVI